MSDKRFIKFMFIGVDDATLRCGVQDNLTGKEYHTVDNMNAKELTDLLNEQNKTINHLSEVAKARKKLIDGFDNENKQLKKQRYDLYMDIARLVEENEQLKSDALYWGQNAEARKKEIDRLVERNKK